MHLDGPEPPAGDKKKRARAIWPWLVLLAITLLMIYAYGQAIETWRGLAMTWRDLVQLFWWIVPNGPSEG